MILAYDVGGGSVRAALADENSRVIARARAPYPTAAPQTLAQRMTDLWRELGEDVPIRATGVAIAGSLDASRTRVLRAENLGLYNAPLARELLALGLPQPLVLLNDADAAALAEWRLGSLMDCRDAMLLTLGTGVGGGLILDGRPFAGGMGNGVEIGHVVLDPQGPACTCGRRGCLEAYASASALARAGQQDFDRDPTGGIRLAAGSRDNVAAQLVLDCARDGDGAARAILAEYALWLARGIAGIAGAASLEAVSLGGGVSLAGDTLLDAVKEQYRRIPGAPSLRLTLATTGVDAGLLGAALAAGAACLTQ